MYTPVSLPQATDEDFVRLQGYLLSLVFFILFFIFYIYNYLSLCTGFALAPPPPFQSTPPLPIPDYCSPVRLF